MKLRANELIKDLIAPSAGSVLQRACACGKHATAPGGCSCNEKREGMLHRAAVSHGTTHSHDGDVPGVVNEVLRSQGQPLDREIRAFMEPRFGYDFSRVRVHTDAKAAESARSVNALAYTVGNNIVLGAGRSPSQNSSSHFVLAHELAHVVQQGGATSKDSVRVAPANDPAEAAADRAAHQVMSNTPTSALQPTGVRLNRLGANPGCTRAQAAEIHQSIFNANSWVRKAVTKLTASPLAAATRSALTHNFGAAGTAANAPAITGVLRAARTDMNSIPYTCAGVADPICATNPCGHGVAGDHTTTICTNVTLATNDAVFRAGCALHEAVHASDATMTAANDSYSGWFGHSSSTAGYPGANPLANADSYTTLAMELS